MSRGGEDMVGGHVPTPGTDSSEPLTDDDIPF